MRYPQELIEEIRSRCDIVDVVGEHVKLKRSGSNYFGLCPFHNEKTGSFSVSPSRQMYHCFGCHKSGDVFSFEMEYMNSSFTEAIEILAARAGVTLPENTYEPSEAEKAKFDKKEQLFEVLRKAAGYYYYKLSSPQGKTGLDYIKGRGLSDETIKNFGLGYSGKYSDELYKYLKSNGYKDSLLRDSGLFNTNEKSGITDRFWNRVMFPICDVRGRVIGFGGRVMGSGEPKYLNSPESDIFNKRLHLFALNIARRTGRSRILLCEGYMDVISLHQAGFTNAVASLGTALTQQQAHLLKRYTKEVVIMYDSDTAGIQAALRAVPLLMDEGINVKVANLSPQKDPDEVIKERGNDGIEEIIKNATNGFLFTIDQLATGFNFDDPSSKTNFIKETAGRLVSFDDEIERENYTDSVCRRYVIDPDMMRRLMSRLAAEGVGMKKGTATNYQEDKKTDEAETSVEMWMLSYLANADGAYLNTKELVGVDDFGDELCAKVASLLYEQLEKGDLHEAMIVSSFSDPDERNKVAGIFYREMDIKDEDAYNRAFTDVVLKLMKQSNQRRMNAWNGDSEEITELMKKKSLIEKYESEGVLFKIKYRRFADSQMSE